MNNYRKINEGRKKQTIISVLFLILHYLVSVNIYLMGDDFMYATFGKVGVISSVKNYYFIGNGRWILNILDSILLKADRYLYVIMVPWLLLLLAILISKISVQIAGKKNKHVYECSLLLVSIIDVSIARETIWWITGGVNYLIPALFFLGTVVYTLEIREKENLSLKTKVLCGVVSVLSATTMEQFALMTVGWLVLLWGVDFLKNKKFALYQINILLLSVLGLVTIVFAPGNSVRVENATESSQNLVIKIIDLFYNNYYSNAMILFAILLIFIETIAFFKNGKKIQVIVAGVNNLYLLGLYLKLYEVNIVVVLLSFLCFVGLTTECLICFHRKIKIECIFIFVILGVGSQIMLLVSTIWGFRTSFSILILYMLVILILTNLVEYNDRLIHPILVGVIIVCVMLPNIKGYRENVSVHKCNIDEVNSEKKEIKLHSMIKEMYGWTNPPLSDFHEKYFRTYYGISDDTAIIYDKKK